MSVGVQAAFRQAIDYPFLDAHGIIAHNLLTDTGSPVVPMVKFIIQFQKAALAGALEETYNQFLAGIESMPAITRRQVVHVIGTPRGTATIDRILEVYYADYTSLQESLQSASGQQAGALLNHFPAGSVEMLFADVYEESGGQTQVER
jgi:hypothetical protein